MCIYILIIQLTPHKLSAELMSTICTALYIEVFADTVEVSTQTNIYISGYPEY